MGDFDHFDDPAGQLKELWHLVLARQDDGQWVIHTIAALPAQPLAELQKVQHETGGMGEPIYKKP